MNQVALAIARKFNWKIFPDGETALAYLGLSEQMVAKYIYVSDGVNKKYTIGKTVLEFKRLSKKEMIINDDKAVLVIQAIRAVGSTQMTADFVEKLSACFTAAEWNRIAKNTKSAVSWVYEIIKQARDIAQGKKNG